VLSLPSAALAAVDHADRIRKRRRAPELIDHARQLAAQHVTTCLVTQHRPIGPADLDPDHLLDLLADEKPTAEPTYSVVQPLADGSRRDTPESVL
jgi:hypothetical protein